MWTKHIKDPSKKKDFEQVLRASTTALGRLWDILDEEEKNLSTTKIDDFDNPSWANRRAYLDGQLTKVRNLKSLIDFIKG